MNSHSTHPLIPLPTTRQTHWRESLTKGPANTGGGPLVGNFPGGVPGDSSRHARNHPDGISGGMPGGMGPGGPGPQQLPPNPGAGPGNMQRVLNQQQPPCPDHPRVQQPRPRGLPPADWSGILRSSSDTADVSPAQPTDGSPREAERSIEGVERRGIMMLYASLVS